MPAATAEQVRAALAAFALDGPVAELRPHGDGHIHDSFVATCAPPGGPRRYLVQRLNRNVFPETAAMVANIAHVTAHLRRALSGRGENRDGRQVLTLVPTRDGGWFHEADDGARFRVYDFVEGTFSLPRPRTPGDAEAAARAFAHFQGLLADYDGPPLTPTIPRFHDTPHRFATFLAMLARDPANRAAGARPEIAAALAGEALADSLASLARGGRLPLRIVHNDTKLDNVLFDEVTGAGVCVTDLDTVMPGLALHDFGDLVRTATSTAAEDEPDPARVTVDPELFLAVARGWLAGAGAALLSVERERLVLAGRLLAYECGLRFLTDHLDGDRYFKTHRPGHNLDRCRSQFALERSLAAAEEQLQRAVEQALP